MPHLHLEWRRCEQFEIAREAPNLLLVGEIGRSYDYDRFLGFLQRQSEIFDRVLVVPGNHEFYNGVTVVSNRPLGPRSGEHSRWPFDPRLAVWSRLVSYHRQGRQADMHISTQQPL